MKVTLKLLVIYCIAYPEAKKMRMVVLSTCKNVYACVCVCVCICMLCVAVVTHIHI